MQNQTFSQYWSIIPQKVLNFHVRHPFTGTREENGKDATHAEENSSNTETIQGKHCCFCQKNHLKLPNYALVFLYVLRRLICHIIFVAKWNINVAFNYFNFYTGYSIWNHTKFSDEKRRILSPNTMLITAGITHLFFFEIPYGIACIIMCVYYCL